MSNEQWWSFSEPEPVDDVELMELRRPDRTYASKSYLLKWPKGSRDLGKPARYVRKVFDDAGPATELEEIISGVVQHGRRVQIELQTVGPPGTVRRLRLQRVRSTRKGMEVETFLELDREGATRLVQLVRAIDHIPAEGGTTIRVDDDVVRDVAHDPDAVRSLYEHDRPSFWNLVESDESARDLVALAHRRKQIERFRRLLNDPAYFEAERRTGSIYKGRERVWQDFLEENPWVLGVGLAGQLFVSWNDAKLEQAIAGRSIFYAGKRTDALMTTAGRIRSMVFAEIKHHETALLESSEYRADCWAASTDLAGGIAQIQQTVFRATQTVQERHPFKDELGIETGEFAYLVRPRSYLIIGNLGQLRSDHGVHTEKFRCFELFRRNMYEPEIITFDELLARAEWHLHDAETSSTTHAL